MNVLTVSMQPDEDGTVELFVEIRAGRFSGHGSAWFNLQALSKSLEAFEEFPLNIDRVPVISGGYWNEAATQLVQEHVHLSVSPLDRLGKLVMTIKAFTPTAAHSGQVIGCGVVCDCLIDYEGLRNFAENMRRLFAEDVPMIQFEAFNV